MHDCCTDDLAVEACVPDVGLWTGSCLVLICCNKELLNDDPPAPSSSLTTGVGSGDRPCSNKSGRNDPVAQSRIVHGELCRNRLDMFNVYWYRCCSYTVQVVYHIVLSSALIRVAAVYSGRMSVGE